MPISMHFITTSSSATVQYFRPTGLRRVHACWLAGTSSPEPAAFLRPDTFPDPGAGRFHVLFPDPGGVERGKKAGVAEEEAAEDEAAEDEAGDAAVGGGVGRLKEEDNSAADEPGGENSGGAAKEGTEGEEVVEVVDEVAADADEDEAEDDARDAAVAEAEEARDPLPNVLAYPSQSGQDTHPMSRYVRCGLLGIVFGRSPRLLYASHDFLLRSFSERAKALASAKGSARARFRFLNIVAPAS